MVSGYLGVVKVCTLLSDSRLIRVSQDGDLGYLFFRVGGKCTIQFLCYDTQQDTYFVLSLFFFLFEDLILTLNRVCFSSVRVTLGVRINVFLCGCFCEFIKANLI